MDRINFPGMLSGITPCDDAEVSARRAALDAEAMKTHVAAQRKALGCPGNWTVASFDATRWPAMAACLASSERRNILAAAPTNTGKSHALCALALKHAAEIRPDGFKTTVFRLREHAFYPLWDQNRYRESGDFREIVRQAIAATVLVYDDLGKVEITRGNGLALTPFGCVVFDIFDCRAEQRKINLVTTRYASQKQLQDVVGDDLIRRVLQWEAEDKSRGVIIPFRNI